MKSILFATTVMAIGFFTSFASASPTTPTSIELEARTFGCKKGQFWYKQRNCCLDNGGPRNPPQPPSGRGCPGSWYWNPNQGCCTPRQPVRDDDPEPQCEQKKWKWKKGSQCCEKDDDKPSPPPPQPSPKPGKDDKDCDDDKKGGDKKGGRNKRDNQAKAHKKVALKKRELPLCPFGMQACPIAALGLQANIGNTDFECIEPQEDVTSCGGCASTGEGHDCTAIPHAIGVACNFGSCSVRTCDSGYVAQGQSCVKL